MSERVFDGKKIKAILKLRGVRVEALAVSLNMCIRHAWTLLGEGKLPAKDKEWREARLCEFLALTNIGEILVKPKRHKAA